MNQLGTVVVFPGEHYREIDEAGPPAELLLRDPAGTGLAIRIAGLAKRFSDKPVLDNVSLDIRPGEFLAIVGHSGCGKSTLLRLIAGLETPTAGTVALDGGSAASHGAEARIMFQDPRLLPWRRVLANVGIGFKGNWRFAAHQALVQVGLDDRADEWPTILSGGQKQRVALARALVSQPRLMLFDEPLGALDALTRLEMQKLVESVWRNQGFTAVLVTHDVGEAVSLADRVVVLRDGRIELIESIDHPRPRRRGDAELAEIEGRIFGRLMQRAASR
jgi:sulfonate transport system ATP-binding protein